MQGDARHVTVLFYSKKTPQIEPKNRFSGSFWEFFPLRSLMPWWCSIHEMAPFWGFLGPFYLKYGSNLLKFWPEVVYHKTKTVFEQCFKIKCLSTNGTYPKFTVLIHFWAQFTPQKTENTAKNQNFPRNCILRTVKWHKFQVPDKLQNSYKNYQKTPFFGPRIGLNCCLGPAQVVNRNSHIAYSIRIFP